MSVDKPVCTKELSMGHCITKKESTGIGFKDQIGKRVYKIGLS